jgi:hypothetical protein
VWVAETAAGSWRCPQPTLGDAFALLCCQPGAVRRALTAASSVLAYELTADQTWTAGPVEQKAGSKSITSSRKCAGSNSLFNFPCAETTRVWRQYPFTKRHAFSGQTLVAILTESLTEYAPLLLHRPLSNKTPGSRAPDVHGITGMAYSVFPCQLQRSARSTNRMSWFGDSGGGTMWW